MGSYALAAGALSGVLAAAGIAKLIQPKPFQRYLRTIVGDSASRFGWRVVPAAELLVAAGLLSPIDRYATVAATLLTVGFVVIASLAWRRTETDGCGCFGALDESTGPTVAVARAAIVFCAALVVLALGAAQSAGPFHQPYLATVGILAGAGCAVAVTVLTSTFKFLTTLEDLLTNPAAQNWRIS